MDRARNGVVLFSVKPGAGPGGMRDAQFTLGDIPSVMAVTWRNV